MRCPVGSPKPCGPIFSSWQVLLVKWYLSHVLYFLRTNKRQKSSLYHHFQVSVSWSMKKYPGAWWGTRWGHRYYILLFNIPDISSASSSLPVSSLRVNEEGNCSESVLESREPGGEQFQDTGIIFLFSTSCFGRYYKLGSKKVIYSIPLWNYTMFSFVCVEGEISI